MVEQTDAPIQTLAPEEDIRQQSIPSFTPIRGRRGSSSNRGAAEREAARQEALRQEAARRVAEAERVRKELVEAERVLRARQKITDEAIRLKRGFTRRQVRKKLAKENVSISQLRKATKVNRSFVRQTGRRIIDTSKGTEVKRSFVIQQSLAKGRDLKFTNTGRLKQISFQSFNVISGGTLTQRRLDKRQKDLNKKIDLFNKEFGKGELSQQEFFKADGRLNEIEREQSSIEKKRDETFKKFGIARRFGIGRKKLKPELSKTELNKLLKDNPPLKKEFDKLNKRLGNTQTSLNKSKGLNKKRLEFKKANLQEQIAIIKGGDPKVITGTFPLIPASRIPSGVVSITGLGTPKIVEGKKVIDISFRTNKGVIGQARGVIVGKDNVVSLGKSGNVVLNTTLRKGKIIKIQSFASVEKTKSSQKILKQLDEVIDLKALKPKGINLKKNLKRILKEEKGLISKLKRTRSKKRIRKLTNQILGLGQRRLNLEKNARSLISSQKKRKTITRGRRPRRILDKKIIKKRIRQRKIIVRKRKRLKAKAKRLRIKRRKTTTLKQRISQRIQIKPKQLDLEKNLKRLQKKIKRDAKSLKKRKTFGKTTRGRRPPKVKTIKALQRKELTLEQDVARVRKIQGQIKRLKELGLTKRRVKRKKKLGRIGRRLQRLRKEARATQDEVRRREIIRRLSKITKRKQKAIRKSLKLGKPVKITGLKLVKIRGLKRSVRKKIRKSKRKQKAIRRSLKLGRPVKIRGIRAERIRKFEPKKSPFDNVIRENINFIRQIGIGRVKSVKGKKFFKKSGAKRKTQIQDFLSESKIIPKKEFDRVIGSVLTKEGAKARFNIILKQFSEGKDINVGGKVLKQINKQEFERALKKVVPLIARAITKSAKPSKIVRATQLSKTTSIVKGSQISGKQISAVKSKTITQQTQAGAVTLKKKVSRRVAQAQKLRTTQKRKLVLKQKGKAKQRPIQRIAQIQRTAQKKRVRTLLKQRTVQKTRPLRITPTLIPKKPGRIIVPIAKKKKRRTRRIKKRKRRQAYNVFARPTKKRKGQKRSKLIRVNKRPLTKAGAKDLRNFIVDHSLSRRGRITRTKGIPKKSRLRVPSGYAKRTANKFRRTRIVKGKRKLLPKNSVIERRRRLLDTISERRGITLRRKIRQISPKRKKRKIKKGRRLRKR